MGTLLIAGPLALDDLPQQRGVLGGVGGYAAIAAAPLARTQLWCRVGGDLTPQLRGVLTNRRIDLSGTDDAGATPRGTAEGFDSFGAILPQIEPTSADDLGGVLLIGLPPEEMRRAWQVIARLPGSAERPVIISPRPADLADVAYRTELCAVATVLVLPEGKARALTGTAKPLEAAQVFQKAGAKIVVLTASQLGGLIAYGGKTTNYPAIPVLTEDAAGVSAAFPGALAAWIAGSGRADFASVKRACAIASAVGSICAQGVGPKKLLAATRDDYLERFNRLRRENKF